MEIDRVLPLVVVPAFLAVFVAIVVLALRAEKKRREGLRRAAEQLGLNFEPDADRVLAEGFAKLHLFGQGHGRRARNLLTGRMRDAVVRLFDYSYATGSGKQRSTHRQSVAVFTVDHGALPDFELRPENVLHKIAAALGYQDIDFPDDPDFSSRYLVRGKDEDAVRRLFDGRLIESLRDVGDICVEGGGAWLVIYRAGRRVKPEQVADFLEQARTLYSAFARRAGARLSGYERASSGL